jgi:hypothetical protein
VARVDGEISVAVGAELSTLFSLHSTFQQTAQQAIDIKTAVDGALDSAQWTGKTSDDFRMLWSDYRVNLDNLMNSLEAAATDVKNSHNGIAAATGESDRI